MPTMFPTNGVVLVTGGNGFIGGHVAKRLASEGCHVRIADANPTSHGETPLKAEVFIGSLLDPSFCTRIMHEVTTVLHFAATMGGMGVIHSQNDFIIYRENHLMTLNILSASITSGVQRFLYASSACVYPDSLQAHGQVDVSLKEADIYADLPPSPQGLYGLEKLNTEHILHQYTSQMEIRIARFHNIFGPQGSWKDGHEKVPAALLRKAFAAKLSGEPTLEIEIWGDGTQRRSFCFIDDAVEAIILLLRSDCRRPVNIGSDVSVTIKELADIAISVANLNREQVRYRYISGKPVGVGSRNSNNDLVRNALGWSPRTSLEEGMRRTGFWIAEEMTKLFSSIDDVEKANMVRRLQTSKMVDLQSHMLTFAILLPITSRGSQNGCLKNLVNFARSLASTTAYDVGRMDKRFSLRVYLAIDHDDEFLLEQVRLGHKSFNKAESILRSEGFSDIETLICKHPPGHVCSLWRDCARRAWQDGCHYFTLMGDDVTLQDQNWMSAVRDAFSDLSSQEHVAEGFGCIAFTDTSFPGMPTFPILHRTHMDIFNGEVIPESFINQDGDPFLYQLYRRWGCSRMIDSRISNRLGGSEEARYQKKPAVNWTLAPLDHATSVVEDWLRLKHPDISRKLTIDVIIPCYRVDLSYVDRFLALQPSSTATVMFIIIVDDPHSSNIPELLRMHSHRPDVRIRINEVNSGASASRNRGLRESSAEWVLFLDDDVAPNEDILIEAEKAIRQHREAAGFVGTALFPVADTIATVAIHLAGVTYFWDIARKRAHDNDLPWGVTANLIVRRNVEDFVEFDLAFPKTGGGEDIDYCRRKRNYAVEHGGGGFHAAPRVIVTHPWWKNGQRSYWRFYMWSKGDGALIGRYPEFSYKQSAPNSAEMLVISMLVVCSGCVACLLTHKPGQFIITFGMRMVVAILVTNILHDLYRHLWRDVDRLTDIKMSVKGVSLILAVVESTVIRIFSEYGRLVGMVERREFGLFGLSFDWFTNRLGDGPRNDENRNRLQRFSLFIVVLAILLSIF